MTSITPTTPYGYTIFCDDARQEIGGKVSLIGIYASTIDIPKAPPFTLPKFCFSIHYMERPDESTEPVELRIYLPGEEEDAPSFKVSLPIEQMRAIRPPGETSYPDQLMHMGINWIVAPLEIKDTGRIRVRAYRGDLEIKLGTIPVNAPASDRTATDLQDQSSPPAIQL